MTGKNTPEYLTFNAYISDLRLAIQSDLINLGLHLMSCGLISSENELSIRNTVHSDVERAARCLELVQRRIEEDQSNFEQFLQILKRTLKHQSILLKVQETHENYCRLQQHVCETEYPVMLSSSKSYTETASPVASSSSKSVTETASPVASSSSKCLTETASPVASSSLKSLTETASPVASSSLKSLTETASPVASSSSKSLTETASPVASFSSKNLTEAASPVALSSSKSRTEAASPVALSSSKSLTDISSEMADLLYNWVCTQYYLFITIIVVNVLVCSSFFRKQILRK